MTRIKLTQLKPDPKNPNVCSPETLEKLKQNIQTSGFYPALIVRAHPKKPGLYMIIDGHHRLLERFQFNLVSSVILSSE